MTGDAGQRRRGLGPAHYAGLLRADFASFATHVFAELHPKTRFQMNWHLRVIAARLAAVRKGKIRRLAIHLPPRHLKSLLASVAFPAWVLGHDQSAEIPCVSYAQALADKSSRDCRRIVAEPVVPGSRRRPKAAASPRRSAAC